MSNILVTGGAGFIGSHLTDALIARGDTVTILDDFSTGSRDNIAHVAGNPLVQVVAGSVTDTPLVTSLAAGKDYIPAGAWRPGRHLSFLQHGRAAPNRSLRHGHPPFCAPSNGRGITHGL